MHRFGSPLAALLFLLSFPVAAEEPFYLDVPPGTDAQAAHTMRLARRWVRGGSHYAGLRKIPGQWNARAERHRLVTAVFDSQPIESLQGVILHRLGGGGHDIDLAVGVHARNARLGSLASFGPAADALCEVGTVSSPCAGEETLRVFREGLTVHVGRLPAPLALAALERSPRRYSFAVSEEVYEGIRARLAARFPEGFDARVTPEYHRSSYERDWRAVFEPLETIPGGARLTSSLGPAGSWPRHPPEIEMNVGFWFGPIQEEIRSRDLGALLAALAAGDPRVTLAAPEGANPADGHGEIAYAPGRTYLSEDGRERGVTRYVGGLRGGAPHGAGTLFLDGSTFYRGEFENGAITGKGAFHFLPGAAGEPGRVLEEGHYRNGAAHGRVRYFNARGDLRLEATMLRGRISDGPVSRTEYTLDMDQYRLARAFVGERSGDRETGRWIDLPRVYHDPNGVRLVVRGDRARIFHAGDVVLSARWNAGRNAVEGDCEVLYPRQFRLPGTLHAPCDPSRNWVRPGPGRYVTPDGREHPAEITEDEVRVTFEYVVRVRREPLLRTLANMTSGVIDDLFDALLGELDRLFGELAGELCEALGREPGRNCHVNVSAGVTGDGRVFLGDTTPAELDYWQAKYDSLSRRVSERDVQWLRLMEIQDLLSRGLDGQGFFASAAQVRAHAFLALAQFDIGARYLDVARAETDPSSLRIALETADRFMSRYSLLAGILEHGDAEGRFAAAFPELVDPLTGRVDPRRAVSLALHEHGAHGGGRSPAGLLEAIASVAKDFFGLWTGLALDDGLFDVHQELSGRVDVRALLHGNREAIRLHQAANRILELRTLYVTQVIAPSAVNLGAEMFSAALGAGARPLPGLDVTEQVWVLYHLGLSARETAQWIQSVSDARTRDEFYEGVRDQVLAEAGLRLGEGGRLEAD